MTIKINFSGDVCFSGFFSKQENIDFFDDKIINFLKDSDYNILNIEGAMSSSSFRAKAGISLASPPHTIEILKQIQCNIFNLANNHIMDSGVDGLQDTLSLAHSEGIRTFGAGLNLSDASSPLFIKVENVTVALIALCHPEGLIASSTTSGIFSDDQTDAMIETIKFCKQKADWVILNYHGGEEFTFVPMPKRRQQFHKYIDYGVDAIVAHHPHVVQGYEIYNDKFIFYSLGNFIFDIPSHKNFQGTNESLILKLAITKGNICFETLFTQINRSTMTVTTKKKNEKFILYKNEFHSLWENACMIFMKHKYKIHMNGELISSEKSFLKKLNKLPFSLQLLLKNIKFILWFCLSCRAVNERPKNIGYLVYIFRRLLLKLG